MNKYEIIDKILSEPIPDYTYEEAKAFLYELGIIDKDGNVKDVFKPYITERKR